MDLLGQKHAIIDTAPATEEVVQLTPEPMLPVTTEEVATLESGDRIIRVRAETGRASNTVETCVIIGEWSAPDTVVRAVYEIGYAAAKIAGLQGI